MSAGWCFQGWNGIGFCVADCKPNRLWPAFPRTFKRITTTAPSDSHVGQMHHEARGTRRNLPQWRRREGEEKPKRFCPRMGANVWRAVLRGSPRFRRGCAVPRSVARLAYINPSRLVARPLSLHSAGHSRACVFHDRDGRAPFSFSLRPGGSAGGLGGCGTARRA